METQKKIVFKTMAGGVSIQEVEVTRELTGRYIMPDGSYQLKISPQYKFHSTYKEAETHLKERIKVRIGILKAQLAQAELDLEKLNKTEK